MRNTAGYQGKDPGLLHHATSVVGETQTQMLLAEAVSRYTRSTRESTARYSLSARDLKVACQEIQTRRKTVHASQILFFKHNKPLTQKPAKLPDPAMLK